MTLSAILSGRSLESSQIEAEFDVIFLKLCFKIRRTEFLVVLISKLELDY